MKIGLTGGIASGKSTVSNYLLNMGYKIIDADKISRDVVKKGTKGLKKIVNQFGKSILNDNDELNRKKLRELVFSNKESLEALNNILHPLIHETIVELFEEYKNEELIIFDVPLLLENKLEHMVDCIWVVSTDYEIQIQRVKDRDKVLREDAINIINKQMPLKEKEKLATTVIYNNGTIKELYEQINELIKTFL